MTGLNVIQGPLRTIKSYVLRGSGLTQRQKSGLDLYQDHYRLPLDSGLWDLKQIFRRESKTIIEIGFGMGHSLFTMANQNPNVNYIGLEVHQAGVGGFAADLHDAHMTNVRIVAHDAVEVFESVVADKSLDGVQIFFPDPWPKKKHHKRRLLQTPFINLLVKKLQTDGFIHVATDWEPYAQEVLSLLSLHPELSNQSTTNGFIERPTARRITKFEEKGINKGHKIFDLLFFKVESGLEDIQGNS